MDKKGSSKKTNILASNSSNNHSNIARSKRVKLQVKNPFAAMVVDSAPLQEQQQRHILAQNPIPPLTAVEFAAAHQQHKEQRQPRNYNPFSDIFGGSAGEDDGDEEGDEEDEASVEQQEPEQENKDVTDDAVLPPTTESTIIAKDLEELKATSTLTTVSTPPSSRTQHQRRDSFRSSLYSNPKS
ncbi:hypothetical protein BGW39_001472 [Mortierella sp. 14UC]|nr:hypothetical protein BGW39_001472 [Mortierella sp. 14UC]